MRRPIRRSTMVLCVAVLATWAGSALAGVVYERTVSLLGPAAGPRGSRSIILTTEIEGGLGRTESLVLGTQAGERRRGIKRSGQGGLVVTDLDREVLVRLQPRLRKYTEVPFAQVARQREARTGRSSTAGARYEWSDSEVRAKTTDRTDVVAGIPVRLVQLFATSSGEMPDTAKTCDAEWTLEAWLADPSTDSAAVNELREYRSKAAAKLDSVPDDLQSAGRAVMDRLDRFGKGWRLLLDSANQRGLPLHSVLILEAEGDCTTNLTAVGKGRGQGQRRASMRKLREQRAGQELPEADPEKAGVPLPPLPDESQVEAQAYEGPLLRMTVRTDRLRATRIPKERFAIPEGYRNASETKTLPAPSSGTE